MGQGQPRNVVLHLAPKAEMVHNVASAATLLKTASELFSILAEDVTFVGPGGQMIRDDKSLMAAFNNYYKDHPKEQEIHLDVIHRNEVDHHEDDDAHGGKNKEPLHEDPEEAAHLEREGSALDFENTLSLEEMVPESKAEDRTQHGKETEQVSMPKSGKVDVLMIGAGPCGLWTAINLKLEAPHLSIVMFEKYASYQRKHVILLSKKSMAGRVKGSDEFDKMCNSFPSAVRTNELEDKLTAMAIKVGVHIVIRNVTDVPAVLGELKPSVLIGSDGSHSTVRDKFMVQEAPEEPENVRQGSSNSFSGTSKRKTVATTAATASPATMWKWPKMATAGWSSSSFSSSPKKKEEGSSFASSNNMMVSRQPKAKEQEVLHRTIQLKYELHEKSGSLSRMEVYALAKVLPNAFTYFEHIGKPSTRPDGSTTTPATLVLGGLSAEQFATLNGVGFRSPMTLGNEAFKRMDVQVQGAVMGYLKAKEMLKKENRVLGSETIAPVSLNIYASSRFSSLQEMPGEGVKGTTQEEAEDEATKKKIAVYLIGDAAFGVPFFRALNSGFVCGSRLGKTVAQQLTSGTEDADYHNVESFHRFMTSLSGSEFATARTKATGLEVARSFTMFTKHKPRIIQVCKLDDKCYHAVKAEVEACGAKEPLPSVAGGDTD